MKEVHVQVGFTKSAGEGSYEFFRVDIGYTDTVGPDDTHDNVADNLYEQVEQKLVEKVKQIDEELGYAARTSKIHAKGYKPRGK